MARYIFEANTSDGRVQFIRWDTKTGERVRDEQWNSPIKDIWGVSASEDTCTISTKNHGWYSVHKAYDILVNGEKVTFEQFVEFINM